MRKGLLLSLPLLLTLFSCDLQDANPLQKSFFAFDTYWSISLYDGDQSNLNDLADIAYSLSDLADSYEKRSVNNVYTLNHSEAPVLLDPLLIELIEGSLTYSKTYPHLSIYLGSLKLLWQERLLANQVPSEEEIAPYLKDIAETSFLNEDGLCSLIGQAKIELGAFAKGFALKKMKAYLDDHSLKQYLIDGGSSSVLLGEKPSKEGTFSVSLKYYPNQKLHLKNIAISTSSIYEQRQVVDGKTYSHIIDPMTGKAEAKLPFVMAFGDDPFLLDALTTSFSLIGEDCRDYESENLQILYALDENKIAYHSPSLEIESK